MSLPVNIFWFRRDLRLHDNAGLYHALKKGKPLVPVFIFDRNILDELEDRHDRRIEFIHSSLQEIQQLLLITSSTLDVRYGYPNRYGNSWFVITKLKMFIQIMTMSRMQRAEMKKWQSF